VEIASAVVRKWFSGVDTSVVDQVIDRANFDNAAVPLFRLSLSRRCRHPQERDLKTARSHSSTCCREVATVASVKEGCAMVAQYLEMRPVTITVFVLPMNQSPSTNLGSVCRNTAIIESEDGCARQLDDVSLHTRITPLAHQRAREHRYKGIADTSSNCSFRALLPLIAALSGFNRNCVSTRREKYVK